MNYPFKQAALKFFSEKSSLSIVVAIVEAFLDVSVVITQVKEGELTATSL